MAVQHVAQLPFKSQILRQSKLQFGGHSFTAEEIVRVLAPHLTVERVQKINRVISERTFNVAVVSEHLYDIGNISAVMRSAESFGFLPFHIIERPESQYKMSDRISRGTEKWLDIKKYKSTEVCVRDLQESGYAVYATDLNATHKIEDIDFSKKTAVVFGNEKDGISPDMRKLATGTFKIPMYGFAQSFNISVAAAITFFHIHNMREQKFSLRGDLSREDQDIVRAHYYLRTLDAAEALLVNSKNQC